MGFITAADNKPYFVILEKDTIEFNGEQLSIPLTITIVKGTENKAFVKYAIERAKREQALSAWDYLQKIYNSEPLFSSQKAMNQSIVSETQRIQKQDADFLSNLPKSSYVGWYLPARKLISSVSTIAQYHTEEISATTAAFRKLDYADSRMYKSGLLKDAIEIQYWLIENSGLPLDAVFNEMNISTDCLLKNIATNEKLFNEITKYLFDYFEKHSLFQPSEYLSVKALSQNSCLLTESLTNQLELYRKMMVGNTVPDILFTGDVFNKGVLIKNPNHLSEINSKYKAVVFGASWCGACAEEMIQLLPLYEKWKAKGIEVVFISMDTDKKAFQDYVSAFPFISFCDYKKWDTQAAKDYNVFGSPTLYLLDKSNTIILRPKGVKAIDAWIDVASETSKE